MRQKGFDFEGAGSRPSPAPGDLHGKAAAPRPPTKAPRRPHLTVRELTDRLQGVVETEFVDVWVEGEISNLRFVPSSGHYYFTLKDEAAQIRAVVFRNDARYIRFEPKDGMKVLARGAVRVYPPRGEYQLVVQVLEPQGKGSLQQAFEDLKERLDKEGLFAAARKRPLPMLPRRIGLVTSTTGAVVRDILRVLKARYANLEVAIYPCRVQGPGAAAEIVAGIHALNTVGGLDVIVLARGGGSLEDLWPFNEEPVARAIAASRVPTISAVGHETDYTIADFVADLRAPTPSAAAERVVKAKVDLASRIENLERHLHGALRLRLARTRARVEAVTSHRVFAAERGRLRNGAQRIDDLTHRAERALRQGLLRAKDALHRRQDRLEAFRFERQVKERRDRVSRAGERLAVLAASKLARHRGELARHAGRLEALSPLGVLARGYALVWDASGARLLRSAGAVQPGDAVSVRLHDGGFQATVTRRTGE
jgi:exodeoxyribonuclease VII large subunit